MRLPAFAGLLLVAASAFSQGWTTAQEADLKALFREGGFYPAVSKVLHGQAPASSLAPWLARLEEPSLVGATIRDALTALPIEADAWLKPSLAALPAAPERDWVLARRADAQLVPPGKFHLTLLPVRLQLLGGVSIVLPNYDWSISFQDPRQVTVQALEKGYSATVHLRWIDRADVDVLSTARLVQMYAGFSPKYLAHQPTGAEPQESDLVTLPPVDPQPLTGQKDILEQVQKGAPDAWQLYAGRTRWFVQGTKVLVAMISVHVERTQRLADLDRLTATLGYLLDTVQFDR